MNEDEYIAARKRIDELADKLDPESQAEMELLANRCEDYEREHDL